MLNRIKTLTKLELTNLFGFNVLIHIRDKKEKRKKIALAVVLGVVVLVAASYVGGLSYGLFMLGMQEIIPAYLTAVASIFILLFGVFKAGHVIFNKEGYDFVSSLPLTQTEIVLSRYLRMYAEGLLLTCVVMLPGIVVYGILVKPAVWFYLMGLAGILFLPLIPLSAAVFVGALIVGISSRMRNKGIVEAALSVLLVVGVMGLSSGLSDTADVTEIQDLEKLKELSALIYSVLGRIYRPSLWLGDAMAKNLFSSWLLFAGSSVAAAAVVIAIVSAGFRPICLMLFGSSAKKNYRMQALGQDSLWLALCKRELKRYFSSGVYVTNTIIGPVMGVVLSVAFFITGESIITEITENIPFELDICGGLPLLLAAALCMMNITCVSVSMEGKNWWIVKSLPLDTKLILDAKILAGMAVIFPFYLVSEVFLMLSLKPGFWDAVWIVSAPLLCIVFCSVFGIAVNLRLPVMNWDSEVSVVKQSASAMAGGLGSALFPLLFAAAVALTPETYRLIVKAAFCVLVFLGTAVLYSKNNQVNLQEIG